MRDRSRNVEDVLPPGARIEEFEIERELQAGGFGVTYLARDRSLGRRVAIKEYLPREWGGRRADGSVGPRSSSHAKDYQWGLTRFLEEARTLARLDHPRIVRVHRVIEAWGTAYMVMEYVEGRNLEEALKAEGPWPEARVRALLEALLPGVALVHAAGLIHRDVKPANVMLRADGTPVLIDFGAARYAAGAHSHSLTSVLTPGYAPFEQYQTGGKQGAWTDVYALGAVAYRALSGQAPVEATARVRADPLAPVSQAAAGGVSESFGAAVTSALAVWPEHRPRDVAAWRAQWDAGAVPAPSPLPSPSPSPAPSPSPSPARSPSPSLAVPSLPQVEGAALPAADKSRGALRNVRRPGLLLAGLAVLVLAAGVAVGLVIDQRPDDAPPADDAAEAEERRLAELRRPARVFRDCDACPEMVVIPAGTFRMGSPASEEGRYDDEGPRHGVTLGSFAMGVKEVTFDEWDACVGGGGCGEYRPGYVSWGRGARPVIFVNWDDAQAYVRWLSERTGAAYRLPSESEWEYAARAGTTTPFHTGATISTDQANYDGRTYVYGSGHRGTFRGMTTPAGTFAPNAFGLYDVHGNVREWVEDCWHADYSGAPSDGTAWTTGGNCSRRVLRGGSWSTYPRYLRSANRDSSTGTWSSGTGFRVARTLD